MHIQIFGNTNGRYQPIQLNLFEQAEKQEQKLTLVKDAEFGKETPEIKVDISEEGLRALHGSGLKGQVNLEEQEKERKFLAEHQLVDSFSNGFRRSLDSLYQKYEKETENNITVEEKGQAVIDAFTTMADEIVAGYADGNRLRFVEDVTSEDGYRKLSIEDELGLLKDEFDDFVNFRFGKERQEQNEKIPDGFAEKLIHMGREYLENIMRH